MRDSSEFLRVDKVVNHKHKYGLDCPYYKKEFDSIEELIEDVMGSGMDPNYEITINGDGMGDKAIDYVVM